MATISNHAFTPTKSTISFHENLKLKKLVLFIRHGDRSQISRSMGQSYPEDDAITEIWNNNLPSKATIDKLRFTGVNMLSRSGMVSLDTDDMYSGWDSVNSPYGMLTELGSSQLATIGRNFHQRYYDLLNISNPSRQIYSRSTNMCRTLLSLRSFLSGFLLSNSEFMTELSLLPKLVSRCKTEETLYPQADGPCAALNERREIIFGEDFLARTVRGYDEYEQKISAILGNKGKPVNWLTVKEVFTCYDVHNIPLPMGITTADVAKASEITGCMWGALYNDFELNRLAIGRFVQELIDDITFDDLYNDSDDDFANVSSPHNISLKSSEIARGIKSEKYSFNRLNDGHVDGRSNLAPNANMLIYSGHDSTLVPLLCALGVYDAVSLASLSLVEVEEWPPYASYLAIEVAEAKDTVNIDNVDDDSMNSIDLTTCDNAQMVAGSLWVRIIYNDEIRSHVISNKSEGYIQSITRIDGAVFKDENFVEGKKYSNEINKRFKTESKGFSWIPFSTFIGHLKRFAVTKSEYELACVRKPNKERSSSKITSTIKQMLDEIQATIGAVKAANSATQ